MGRWARRTFVWMAAILTATATTVAADEVASSGVAALNGGDTDTRVAGASGYHAYLLAFDAPVTFDTLVLKEFEKRITSVEIRPGDFPEGTQLIHPDPPDVKYNWFQPPFGEKAGGDIVIHTGKRTARCIQVNLYRGQSATVAPPSVREIELYLEKDESQ